MMNTPDLGILRYSIYLVDIHVMRDSFSSDPTLPVDNVDHTRWEAGLRNETSGIQSGERREFRRLHDDGIAGCQSRTQLPCQHHD